MSQDDIFENLEDPVEETPGSEFVPVPEKTEENSVIRHLDPDAQSAVTESQKASIKQYMDQMKFGVMGVTAITCKAEQCTYYSKCPLAKAKVPLPKGEDCPVEIDLQHQWMEGFVRASGIQLEMLGAYDMLLLSDLAYQQVLEARAAMELADNPQIQVKTFMGTDPSNGEAMYTYGMNNLVTFREKSGKMKMKILQEMIATAKAKSSDKAAHMDRSSESAMRLKRIKDALGEQAIDAEFEVKKPAQEEDTEKNE